VFGLAVKVILACGAEGVNPQNLGLIGTIRMYFVVKWRSNRPVPALANWTLSPYFLLSAAAPASHRMRFGCAERSELPVLAAGAGLTPLRGPHYSEVKSPEVKAFYTAGA